MPRRPIPIEVRFWKHVNKTDGCWLWTGSVGSHGYGVTTVGGKPMMAHRASWLLFTGSECSECVLHHCDTPLCVRPDHLFKGTRTDNAADRDSKGRGVVPGDKNKRSICKRGHDNWYIRSNGRKMCKTCVADNQRARNANRIHRQIGQCPGSQA